jgi:hypothetical protein
VKNRFQNLPFKFNLQRYIPEEDLLKYCFSASFIVAALHDAMGIGMEEELRWGCTSSRIQLTSSLTAPGFNPSTFNL